MGENWDVLVKNTTQVLQPEVELGFYGLWALGQNQRHHYNTGTRTSTGLRGSCNCSLFMEATACRRGNATFAVGVGVHAAEGAGSPAHRGESAA